MKKNFSPANNTLAVLVPRGSSEPVASLAVATECVLLVALFSIVKGIFTYYKDSHVTLPAGITAYFVQSEVEGYSYLVFLYNDGSHLCSCKESRNGLPCSHADMAREYRLAEKAGLLERKELRNGTTLYLFASESQPGYIYMVTSRNGIMDNHTHQDCLGYRCSKYGCKHSNYIEFAERETYTAYQAEQHEMTHRHERKFA